MVVVVHCHARVECGDLFVIGIPGSRLEAGQPSGSGNDAIIESYEA